MEGFRTYGTYNDRPLNRFVMATLIGFWLLGVVATYWPQSWQKPTPEEDLRGSFTEHQLELRELCALFLHDNLTTVTYASKLKGRSADEMALETAPNQVSRNRLHAYHTMMNRIGIRSIHRVDARTRSVQFEVNDVRSSAVRGFEFVDPTAAKSESGETQRVLLDDNWYLYPQ